MATIRSIRRIGFIYDKCLEYFGGPPGEGWKFHWENYDLDRLSTGVFTFYDEADLILFKLKHDNCIL